jgi:glycosyltransferase involved in cell wall biosynthesis
MKTAPEKADILVGIASYNNAKTISHVVQAVDAGLAKYYPDKKALIVNSDGGSEDGTPEAVRAANLDHSALMLSHPILPAHRISMPYSGIPGKGSAFRAIFQMAVDCGAEACCVVDADLRSITPEWLELLLSPVMKKGFDFVSPLYSRHKFDGTITNSIIYPMTRALYGRNIRQPIGGDFGFSGRLAKFYLDQDVWETHVARFGIDIWMTTEAIANGFNVCQTFLGAKIHDPKDPGANLADMLVQVVVTLFNLTAKHHRAWKSVKASEEVPTFGFKYHVGLEPIKVDVTRMLDIFRAGIKDLKEIWIEILGEDDFRELEAIGGMEDSEFGFPSGLWPRIIYNYAVAYHKKKMSSEHLIKSLIPLYLGKTAAFVLRVMEMDQSGAEEEIEALCKEFEESKGFLVDNWNQGG